MSGDARERILTAFRDLAIESGFDTVSVRDIVARAEVARSTFYENFENKSDGFRAILEPVLVPLADACTAGADRRRLASILMHIRETPAARSMGDGTSRALFVGALAELIEARLETLRGRTPSAPAAPLPMIAAWIAEAEIGVVTAWLDAERPAPVDAVVTLILTAARSCAQACVSA